jgi:hypothetical protein
MSMAPFKLFGARERSHVLGTLREAVAAWSDSWLPAGIPAPVAGQPAAESKPATRPDGSDRRLWRVERASGGRWLAVSLEEGECDAFARIVCGAVEEGTEYFVGGSPLGGRILREAFGELASALFAAAGSAPESAADEAPDCADCWRSGSAAYAAEIALPGVRLRVLASADWTLELLKRALPAPAAASLWDLRRGIGGTPVELRAIAGWADVELGVMAQLRVGDVIALDTRVDERMTLVTRAGLPVCGVQLGRVDARRAVSLAARN